MSGMGGMGGSTAGTGPVNAANGQKGGERPAPASKAGKSMAERLKERVKAGFRAITGKHNKEVPWWSGKQKSGATNGK